MQISKQVRESRLSQSRPSFSKLFGFFGKLQHIVAKEDFIFLKQ